MTLIAIGLLMFSGVPVDGTYASDVLPASLVAGAGLGFSFVPVTIAAVNGVRDRDAGLASGLINTSQQIGGGVGVAGFSPIAPPRPPRAWGAPPGGQRGLPPPGAGGVSRGLPAGARGRLLLP